ncbi:hypothetical protein M8J77_001196 [Diaphorina citri]|nr:hypothetical protein M8J77_001196 [Diaphorina citri]
MNKYDLCSIHIVVTQPNQTANTKNLATQPLNRKPNEWKTKNWLPRSLGKGFGASPFGARSVILVFHSRILQNFVSSKRFGDPGVIWNIGARSIIMIFGKYYKDHPPMPTVYFVGYAIRHFIALSNNLHSFSPVSHRPYQQFTLFYQ